MNKKNLVLALAAFVVAIGTAFGTSLIPVPTYIETQADEESQFVCTNLGYLCEDVTGGDACTIVVTVTKTNPDMAKAVPGRKSYGGYCDVLLKNGIYNYSSILAFYDAR